MALKSGFVQAFVYITTTCEEKDNRQIATQCLIILKESFEGHVMVKVFLAVKF